MRRAKAVHENMDKYDRLRLLAKEVLTKKGSGKSLAEAVLAYFPRGMTVREGYWHAGAGSKLPRPRPLKKPWPGKELFLKKLREKEKLVYRQSMKGSSRCRCCGKNNGSQDYQLLGWQWPQGLIHYIEKHNVRPSLAFQEFILGDHLT